MSPYFGKTFFSFFATLFHRIFGLLSGSLSFNDLASDEIQVFVLCLISIASTLVGSLLFLKKMTMLANALSHTILIGIVGAYLLVAIPSSRTLGVDTNVLVLGALITGLLTTFFTNFLKDSFRLEEDASIGLVFTTLFALGIVFVALYTKNAHIGTEVVMGNIDALALSDLKMVAGICLLNAVVIFLLFKEWQLICFDAPYAKSLGYRPGAYNYLLMFLTSLSAIGSFRAVGVLLFLAFLVGLPAIARLFTSSLKKMLWIGSIVGVICSSVSVAFSRHLLSVYQLPLSTGALSVVSIGICFLISIFLTKFLNQRALVLASSRIKSPSQKME